MRVYQGKIAEQPFAYNIPVSFAFQDVRKRPTQLAGLNLSQIDIDKSVLNKMHKLISPAVKGEIFKSQNKCFDSGSGTYTAYLFDSKTGQYKPVLLYQVGDRPKKNLSDEAKSLYEWLFEVFGNNPKNCTP